jgi:transcriptional regulator with XRE-family HTH domain
MDVSIGARIKAARTAAGMTQMDVARRTELSLQAVGDIERGIVRDPHISSLRQIAHALGIPVTQMLEDSFREPVPLAEAPPPPGQAERAARTSSFHKDAETFNGLADLLRWQLANVQPEQLPSLVYEGIAVVNWAAQQKRRDVDPLLDDALGEELAAAQEVEKALSAIEEVLYAIGDEAERQNAAIAAGVKDELAARRRRRKAGLGKTKQRRRG